MGFAQQTIGFIGLGAMGLPMAKRLIYRGFKVVGYDVSKDARTLLLDAGGEVAKCSREVVELGQCHVLVVMVATAEQASSVLLDDRSGAAATLPAGSTIMLCITAAPHYAVTLKDSIDKDLGRADLTVLDCPVSGGAGRAADGTLSILTSGAVQIPELVISVLAAMSTTVTPVPGPLGSAFAIKMVHQILVGVHIVAAVETAALATIVGLDLPPLTREIMNSEAASWIYGERTPHLHDLDHAPHFSLAIILKDLNAVVLAAQEKRSSVFLTTVAQQIFLTAKMSNLGDHDCSPIHLYILENTKRPRVASSPGSDITAETIQDLLMGIHLAAALECFSLIESFQLDWYTFFRFVNSAAGASRVFAMFGNTTDLFASVIDSERAREIVSKMTVAVRASNYLQIPTPLSQGALNCLFAAIRKTALRQ